MEEQGYTRIQEEDPFESQRTRALRKCFRWTATRFPFVDWVSSYRKSYVLSDLVGGTTIGMVCLAQTLAHAAIATTKPIQGPYCAFMPAIGYALMGTSPHASVSSGAIAAILIADQLRPWADVDDRTELASLLALVSGVSLFLMGVFNLAFAIRFLSAPTISAFVTGGAFLIVTEQSKNWFGFQKVPHTEGWVNTLKMLLGNWRNIQLPSLLLGFLLMCLIHFFNTMKDRAKKKVKEGHPRFVVAVRITEMKEIFVAAIGVTVGYLTHETPLQMTTIGNIPSGLPPFHPPWDIRTFKPLVDGTGPAGDTGLQNFIFGGVLVSLTTFLTTYAVAKRMALKYGYRLDPAQEMVGLGTAGVAGSFFGAFPPSGSLSRTGLAADCGVKTQMGGLICASVVGLGLQFLTPMLKYMPKTTLAAIIIMSTKSLLDISMPRKLWTMRARLGRDLVVWVVTFLLTLFVGVLPGIASGVVISVTLTVADAAGPQAVVLGRVDEKGRKWRNLQDWPKARTFPGILVFEFRGPLAFASAEWFQEQIEKKRMQQNEAHPETPVKIIIISVSSVHQLDYSALLIMEELLSEWKRKSIWCIFSGAKHKVRELIDRELKDRAKLLDQTDFMISVNDAVQLARKRLEAHAARNLDEDEEKRAIESGRAIQRAFRTTRPSLRLGTASRVATTAAGSLGPPLVQESSGNMVPAASVPPDPDGTGAQGPGKDFAVGKYNSSVW